MGEFSQNLLKLTEFPFSYSLLGLLALIFGQGSGVEELNFAKFGPLLILMGFLATVLSICDPVGAIQRLIIKGRGFKPYWDFFDENTDGTPRITHTVHDLNQTIFGTNILWGYFELTPLYMLSMLYSPKDIKKRYPNFKPNLVYWIATTGKLDEESIGLHPLSGVLDTAKLRKDIRSTLLNEDKADKLVKDVSYDFTHIMEGLADLKQNTVRTKWITAEIDRITALFYFIIIISVFIIATLVYPSFFQHFRQIFPDIEATRLVILILSSMALGAVVIALGLRIKGLETKASTVFRYLIALQTIKSTKENFRTTLQDIERYLNDNEWALAGYWVDRVLLEYRELLREEVDKPTESIEEKYKQVNEYF